MLVLLWAAAGTAVGLRRRDAVAPILLSGAVVLAVASATSAVTRYASPTGSALLLADAALRCSLCLLPALALHFLGALPDGRLRPRARRTMVLAGYVVAVALGLTLLADRTTPWSASSLTPPRARPTGSSAWRWW